MWTRGKDKQIPGKFEYELFDGNKMIERVGGFATAQAADRAAEIAQRRVLFPATDCEMTDDELLAALMEE